MMSYLGIALSKLKQFEGCVPWMYLDTRGNVTVGIGLMLSDAAAAEQLNFQQSTASSEAADRASVLAEFERVSGLQPGRSPGYYRSPLSPVLSMATMEQLCRSRIEDTENELRRLYPGYDALPDPAKAALIDMQYNLGTSGLSRFVRLRSAIEDGDFHLAAAECNRNGIQPARNLWVKQQFGLAMDMGYAQETSRV